MLISRNPLRLLRGLGVLGRGKHFMPSRPAWHRPASLGRLLHCTRHMRQLAAIDSSCDSRSAVCDAERIGRVHHGRAVLHFICLPSISSFGIVFSGRMPAGSARSGEIAAGTLTLQRLCRCDTGIRREVLTKLFTVRRGIAQSADGAPGDVVGYVVEQFQVFCRPFPCSMRGSRGTSSRCPRAGRALAEDSSK